MLTITIPKKTFYDEANNMFIDFESKTIKLEHSLVSLSKWESKWEKPYISKVEKTDEEMIDYIKCMTITQNVEDSVYKRLSPQNLEDITAYIESPMTATTITRHDQKKNQDIITAEVIYFWMTIFNIPMECQKWHLNRLLTLVAVCDAKQSPGKKMSQREQHKTYDQLNEERKRKFGIPD